MVDIEKYRNIFSFAAGRPFFIFVCLKKKHNCLKLKWTHKLRGSILENTVSNVEAQASQLHFRLGRRGKKI